MATLPAIILTYQDFQRLGLNRPSSSGRDAIFTRASCSESAVLRRFDSIDGMAKARSGDVADCLGDAGASEQRSKSRYGEMQ